MFHLHIFWYIHFLHLFRPFKGRYSPRRWTNNRWSKIIHIPGHTDGSICLYKEGEALFAGDTLRTTSKKEPRLPPSFLSVSMNQLKDSLKKILPLKYGMLLVGHGPPILDNASEQVYRLVNMYQ